MCGGFVFLVCRVCVCKVEEVIRFLISIRQVYVGGDIYDGILIWSW